MATSFEIWSFMNKFQQLSHSGSRAEMHLSCINGKVWINLHTEVENVGHFSPPNHQRVRAKSSPSRMRRRQRRRKDKYAATANGYHVDESRNFEKNYDRAEDSYLICFDDDNDCTTINEVEEKANFQETSEIDTTSLYESPIQENPVKGDPISLKGTEEITHVTRISEDKMEPRHNIIPQLHCHDEPSEVEIQMYRMLQHITSRM